MIKNIISLISLIIAATYIGKANADIVEVTELYLEFEKTFGTNRQYYLPQDSVPKNNVNLGMNMEDGLGILYFNNVISSTTDQSQFRYVALDSEFGINFTFDAQ